MAGIMKVKGKLMMFAAITVLRTADGSKKKFVEEYLKENGNNDITNL